MCSHCGFEIYEGKCEDLLNSNKLKYTETVEGIYDFIQENHHVTEKQIDLIDDLIDKFDVN